MPTVTKEMLEARASQVRVGGAGSMRRPMKAAVRSAAGDQDKQVNATLKKFGLNPIGDVEEVVMYKSDGQMMQFKNPRVQMGQQIIAVSGRYEQKASDISAEQARMADVMAQLQRLQSNPQLMAQVAASQAAAAGGDATAAADAE